MFLHIDQARLALTIGVLSISPYLRGTLESQGYAWTRRDSCRLTWLACSNKTVPPPADPHFGKLWSSKRRHDQPAADYKASRLNDLVTILWCSARLAQLRGNVGTQTRFNTELRNFGTGRSLNRQRLEQPAPAQSSTKLKGTGSPTPAPP